MNRILRLADAATPERPSRQLDLRVERRGGRSFVARQFVTYPFHLTRAFHLDPALPEVATIYMQSSSGGLYAGEDLHIGIHVGAGAALNLTTQASTMVHGHKAQAARTRVEITVERGGFLAYTPDPQILFPGAASDTVIDARMDEDAVLFLSDGFLMHDPAGTQRPPVFYRSGVSISDEGGRVFFADRQRIDGGALVTPSGPLTNYRVSGSAICFGLPDDARRQVDWERSMEDAGTLGGATSLAGGCGTGARILSMTGNAFQAASAALFASAFEARFGVKPSARRK